MNAHPGMPDQEFDIAEPYAPAMLESLRAIGYNTQTAIADLIDNSITAAARNIWLSFFWNGADSYITIRDDGEGMKESELINAMRPGSRNPLETRSAHDLGRFGMGLKTASLSQCKRFTVKSKMNGVPPATRRWDLEYVEQTGEWRLLRSAAEGSESRLEDLDQTQSGTVVLLEIIDRVVGKVDIDDRKAHDHFLEVIELVENHLAMVFHRFLETPSRLCIYINNQRVEPWDPFLRHEIATQFLPEETFYDDGSKITVQPYVLPHHTKISQQLNDWAAGINGWSAQQGFYIYRNKRLLVDGDWLGIGFQKEEHFRLARIQVDLPNSLDSTWKIDVKKSKARPPTKLKSDFKRIASLTRKQALEVYRYRGKTLIGGNRQEDLFPWQRKVKHGKAFYSIDREHPLVQRALSGAEDRKVFNALLRFLEETVPVQQIWLDSAGDPDNQITSFEDTPPQEVLEVMREIYQALCSSGLSHKKALFQLVTMEPFQKFKDSAMELFEEDKEDL